MTKAKRAMKEDMKLIDLVIELVNARIPLSSRNPDIDDLGAGRARIVLLNKLDLAGERRNARWVAWSEDKGIHVVKIDTRNKRIFEQAQSTIQEACKGKIERSRRGSIFNRPIRTMVVGAPGIGRSTFINSFAGRACTKAGNKSGVTKGNRWTRLNKMLELLDTLGILWSRFKDQQVGLKLAFIGSINDQILNKGELAWEFMRSLKKRYPQMLSEQFGLEAEGKEAVFILEEIARVRTCLLEGEDLDVSGAAILFLDDFKAGKLGQVTLEELENQKDKVG